MPRNKKTSISSRISVGKSTVIFSPKRANGQLIKSICTRDQISAISERTIKVAPRE